ARCDAWMVFSWLGERRNHDGRPYHAPLRVGAVEGQPLRAVARYGGIVGAWPARRRERAGGALPGNRDRIGLRVGVETDAGARADHRADLIAAQSLRGAEQHLVDELKVELRARD